MVETLIMYKKKWNSSFYQKNAIYEIIRAYETNSLVLKVQDSQSRGPRFKTTGLLQGWLSLSFFWDQLNEY